MRYLHVTPTVCALGMLSSVTAEIKSYNCEGVEFSSEAVEYTSDLAKSIQEIKIQTAYRSFKENPYPRSFDLLGDGVSQAYYIVYPILQSGEKFMRQRDAGPFRIVMNLDWNVVHVIELVGDSHRTCEIKFAF